MRTHVSRPGHRLSAGTAGGAPVVQRFAAPRPFAAQPAAVDQPRTLPDAVRGKMERAFGHDFSRIRVHEGGSAPAIGARAFARGESLHFAPGAFRPHSREGQAVLGHELAHVVQQRAWMVRPTTRLGGRPADLSPALESGADRAGALAARGEAVAGPLAA